MNQLVRDICLKPATFIRMMKIYMLDEIFTMSLLQASYDVLISCLPMHFPSDNGISNLQYFSNYNDNYKKTSLYLGFWNERRQLLSLFINCTARVLGPIKIKQFSRKVPTDFDGL